MDFLLDDQSAQNHEPSEIIEPPVTQIKDMRAEQDDTKLDFSDHEAPTESVLIDDYGLEEAEEMAAKEVEEPAFVVDEDRRSVQFSDVAGSDNYNQSSAKKPAPKKTIDQASIKVVNKILLESSVKEKPAAKKVEPKQIASKPKEMVPPSELTEEARSTIDLLNQHLSAKEFEKLGELIFDVEMEDELSA